MNDSNDVNYLEQQLTMRARACEIDPPYDEWTAYKGIPSINDDHEFVAQEASDSVGEFAVTNARSGCACNEAEYEDLLIRQYEMAELSLKERTAATEMWREAILDWHDADRG
jgi:hypothetical protein